MSAHFCFVGFTNWQRVESEYCMPKKRQFLLQTFGSQVIIMNNFICRGALRWSTIIFPSYCSCGARRGPAMLAHANRSIHGRWWMPRQEMHSVFFYSSVIIWIFFPPSIYSCSQQSSPHTLHTSNRYNEGIGSWWASPFDRAPHGRAFVPQPKTYTNNIQLQNVRAQRGKNAHLWRRRITTILHTQTTNNNNKNNKWYIQLPVSRFMVQPCCGIRNHRWWSTSEWLCVCACDMNKRRSSWVQCSAKQTADIPLYRWLHTHTASGRVAGHATVKPCEIAPQSVRVQMNHLYIFLYCYMLIVGKIYREWLSNSSVCSWIVLHTLVCCIFVSRKMSVCVCN